MQNQKINNVNKNLVIVGAQWGDEGKGKLVDWLTEKADVVVRFQGGHNAGHTLVINGQKIVLHLLPAGVMHPHTQCVIGNGVVVHLPTLKKELEAITAKGVTLEGRLFISMFAPLIMPYHSAMDIAREKAIEGAGGEKIGTTGRGIGPTYEDKVARRAIRLIDLLDEKIFREKLAKNLDLYNFLLKNYYKTDIVDINACTDEYLKLAEIFRPMAKDTAVLLNNAHKAGKKIIFEGAQGSLLDIDHGTYPYVTSSNTLSGNAACGTGMSPSAIGLVLGIIKAYITRVGGGPMPTELFDEDGKTIATRGAEFGATTGRARRCGWFDVPLAKRTIMLNGIDKLAMMKLDVLDTLSEIKICTHYLYKGEKLTIAPTESNELAQCQPVYETVGGWQSDITKILDFDKLPATAIKYIKRIEELCETTIDIVSVSPERNGTIIRSEIV